MSPRYGESLSHLDTDINDIPENGLRLTSSGHLWLRSVCWQFERQGTLVRTRVIGMKYGCNNGGIRRRCYRFSTKSRMYFQAQLHRVAWDNIDVYQGVVLTFPEFCDRGRTVRLIHDVKTAKKCLDLFCRRLLREVPWLVWKFEFGEKTRREHFHLLLPGRVRKGVLTRHWRAVLRHVCGLTSGYMRPVHREAVRSGSASRKYLAKYVSKGSADVSAVGGNREALDSVPKTDADRQHTGRFWGFKGRRLIPKGEHFVGQTFREVTYVHAKFRRVMRGYVRGSCRKKLETTQDEVQRKRLRHVFKHFGRSASMQGRQVLCESMAGSEAFMRALIAILEEVPPGMLGRSYDEEQRATVRDGVDLGGEVCPEHQEWYAWAHSNAGAHWRVGVDAVEFSARQAKFMQERVALLRRFPDGR